jgi:S-adenosylmethionine synthetase
MLENARSEERMTSFNEATGIRRVTAHAALHAPDVGPVEMVERKGLGHPDSICDTLAEGLSRELCRTYLRQFGRILHYNVDKALLRGGRSKPAFGGGEVLEPIGLYMAGRAVTEVGGVRLPLDETVEQVCRDWLQRNLHALDARRHVQIFNLIRPGSRDLIELFGRPGKEQRLSNDTSFGVGFAPFSRLERTVLAAERFLAEEARQERPEVGEDVKVMGLRLGTDVRLTISCAFVGRHVHSLADYTDKKTTLAAALAGYLEHVGLGVTTIVLNAADDPGREQIFLTVTGTSAEAGDDGQVGRGNRSTGLITPYRPMTLEATAGKNPLTHVGKLYNEAAQELAESIVASLPEVAAAECYLVSSIGRPIEQPMACDVRLGLRQGATLDASLRRRIDGVTDEVLCRLPEVWRRFIG